MRAAARVRKTRAAVIGRDLDDVRIELVQHDGQEKTSNGHGARRVGLGSAAGAFLAAQRENGVVEESERLACERQGLGRDEARTLGDGLAPIEQHLDDRLERSHAVRRRSSMNELAPRALEPLVELRRRGGRGHGLRRIIRRRSARPIDLLHVGARKPRFGIVCARRIGPRGENLVRPQARGWARRFEREPREQIGASVVARARVELGEERRPLHQIRLLADELHHVPQELAVGPDSELRIIKANEVAILWAPSEVRVRSLEAARRNPLLARVDERLDGLHFGAEFDLGHFDSSLRLSCHFRT